MSSVESCSIADTWGLQPILYLSSTRKAAFTITHLHRSTTASKQSLQHLALPTGSLLILGCLFMSLWCMPVCKPFSLLPISLMRFLSFRVQRSIILFWNYPFSASHVKLPSNIHNFRHNPSIPHPGGIMSCMMLLLHINHQGNLSCHLFIKSELLRVENPLCHPPTYIWVVSYSSSSHATSFSIGTHMQRDWWRSH